jgi:hypothetical protein
MIKGVQADAGKHIESGTSQGSGHVKILDGHNNVKVNNIPIAKHNGNCLINCDASGNGGAKGKLVTEQKSVTASASTASNPQAPPGQRTSDKLARLTQAKAKLEAGQLDFNALDDYVNFKDGNAGLDGFIGKIHGTPGSASDYAAQATRGVLGFVKDGVMGIGEMAYEGIKAVPKIGRSLYTSSGQAISQLDAQILAENIQLGNITPGTIGQGALDIGKAMVKPVTDPWKKGQYVEAGTRAVTEVGTLAFGWIKGSKAAQAAKAADALKAEQAAEAAKVAAAAEAAKAEEVANAAKTEAAADGVHVKSAPKRPRPEPNGFDGPESYKTHGLSNNSLDTPEGKRLVQQYKDQDMTDGAAQYKARELIESGATLPKAIELTPGESLYKVVPEGGTPGKYSAYFGTEQEINSLKGLSYDQISDRLGIPLESQQTLRFDVVKVTANQPITVFESVIARTTQNGYAQPGGGIQTLITNRAAFTDPVLTARFQVRSATFEKQLKGRMR